MKRVSKREILELIASLPQGEQKRRLIAHMIETNQISEDDIADLVVKDVRQNADQYAEMFKTDDVLRLLWDRFRDHPRYLARALVRVSPEVFYAYGFAFRLVMKLRADLGPVVIPPSRPNEGHDPSIFMERLPKMVQDDLIALDQERTFREYLYLFSRDPEVGFELLEEAIAKDSDPYSQRVLKNVRAYCRELLSMSFPDFVSDIEGSLFPSFHVRWWIEQAQSTSYLLNTGDTGAHKTAFATVAMHHGNCRKILVLCKPHARSHWAREIQLYFKNPENRVLLVKDKQMVAEALTSEAQYIVVGYSTLIQKGVAETLEAIPFDGLIWDECHCCNNISGKNAAKRAVTCARLIRKIKFKRLFALSATPWENHPRELGAIACALRPDVFPTVKEWRQARPDDPRFLREFLASQILEVELREILDLQPITPKPWEDLFGAELIGLNSDHQRVYEFVREDGEEELKAAQKVQRLLLTAIHPHKVESRYKWPADLAQSFTDWRLSTKLQWLRERVTRELAEGAKVVVATGIYAEGITRPEPNGNGEEIWVGRLLQDWFPEKTVLILDQTVSQCIDQSGSSERDRLIQRWRNDPDTLLLVSMRTCPDSVNLSVPQLAGITKLFLTALSYPWVPWKQFQGRLWRPGLGVPVEYCVPVLSGTIDASLLRLVTHKWEVQQLFRAMVPLTEEEMQVLSRRVSIRELALESRSDLERVNIIGNMARGQGEQGAREILGDKYGTSTNAEVFARAFLATQEYATSGHIARCMEPVITKMIKQGLIHSQGILDAGCGPLTLERYLNQPVYGVDMNPHMIQLGRVASESQGVNARVGLLSQLPQEWTGKFELTTASLVLDWLSLAERAGVLGELVRLTHPQGRIWVTATQKSMNENILSAWIQALQALGFTIIEELTGLVQAKGASALRKPFSFWSLCFSPNDQVFTPGNSQAFRFVFETERRKRKRGGGDDEWVPRRHQRVIHRDFDVIQVLGDKTDIREAANEATEKEVRRLAEATDLKGWRFHHKPELDWRTLAILQERGLMDEARKRGLI